ncbi:MAG: tRNA lysidine(34) synthetase TilS [Candidatus Margulisbacteria bacterium]|nr:tRNA lysidine(34) synthetase TilS [Candidatus Margulisiibacteriota bacterium]
MLTKRILDFIQSNQLLDFSRPILVSFSGGPDSVFLAHALKELAHITLIYFDHGLRSSDTDIAILKSQNLPYHSRKIPVKTYAQKKQISLEMSGRVWRYKMLLHYQKLLGISQVVTAHHQDDHIETFYLNLHRGQHFLGGIRAKKTFGIGHLSRPLLCITKSEILTHLNTPYSIDETNTDLTYQRNQWRQRILPTIETHYPQYRKTLTRHLQTVTEDEAFFDTYISPSMTSLQKTKTAIEWTYPADFATHAIAIQKREIAKFLGEHTSYDHIEILRKAILFGKIPALYTLPNGVLCDHLKNKLRLSWGHELQPIEYPTLHFPTTIRISIYKLSFSISKVGEGLNYDQIKGRTCSIRFRQKEDRLQLNRSPHSKRLKDFMIDKKIPRSERDRLPLFFVDNELVWIMGYYINDHYRITSETQEILRIEEVL